VYITWQIIPLTAKSNNSEFAALSTVIYAHAYFSYLLIYPFIKPTNKLKNSGVFDYRVPVFGSQIKTNILMQLIGIALPVVLGEVFAKKYSEVPRAIGITFWTFVIFEIAYFLRLVATHIYFIKTGYQHISSITRYPKYSVPVKLLGYLALTYLLLLGAFNIYGLCYGLAKIYENNSIASDAITLGFDFLLLNIIITHIFWLILSRNTRNAVERLERDIIIYDLPDEEVKKRIEEDVLENMPLTAWISEKQKFLQVSASCLLQKIEDIVKLSEELDTIDEEYGLERRGRISRFMKDFDQAFDSYERDVTLMAGWLKTTKGELLFDKDKYLKEIIDRVIEDLAKLVTEVDKKWKSTRQILREITM